ncbi:DUF4178 domain-containing protein [Gemmobacter caeruleus]|uniref:DUF4178 domain-containing protein n=1 Tax=Gemmobacter caeruleus TaxID=2595004 RepID=UPI0013968765|nr:DUF4178 domain-containing protein [Gemmobacter caeruleus]
MTARSCPSCGDVLAPRFAAAKMITCASCGTTLFLEDDAVRLAGQQGVLHELPAPIQLGQEFLVTGRRLLPVGLLRYDYGRGTWDEYWCLDSHRDGFWISVDEGDLVVQSALPASRAPKLTAPPGLGQTIRFDGRDWDVQEQDSARLIGWRGELPEQVEMGEAHRFVNCAHGDYLLSGEFWKGGSAWFLGQWIDPYDLRPGKTEARA